jgi:hypothetical protein
MPKEFPGASYDNWKTTNPDDAHLNMEDEEEAVMEAILEEVMQIGEFSLRVAVLEDGTRIIPAEEYERFLQFLQAPDAPTD